mmetsp:Transcript_12492/g.46669  ORF Transcript_12492/g.46669 Transcript_12492/m.46669 type:complete len:244 (+) Transcript_12492:3801-4532(+)
MISRLPPCGESKPCFPRKAPMRTAPNRGNDDPDNERRATAAIASDVAAAASAASACLACRRASSSHSARVFWRFPSLAKRKHAALKPSWHFLSHPKYTACTSPDVSVETPESRCTASWVVRVNNSTARSGDVANCFSKKTQDAFRAASDCSVFSSPSVAATSPVAKDTAHCNKSTPCVSAIRNSSSRTFSNSLCVSAMSVCPYPKSATLGQARARETINSALFVASETKSSTRCCFPGKETLL